MSSYNPKSSVRLTVTFQYDSADTDPTTVVFESIAPDGTTTSYTFGTDAEVVKEATGVYYVDLELPDSGTYYWRFYGTGAVKASEEGEIQVLSSEFEGGA